MTGKSSPIKARKPAMFKEITDYSVRGDAPFLRSHVTTGTLITAFLCASFAGFRGKPAIELTQETLNIDPETLEEWAGIYIAVQSDAILVKGSCCGTQTGALRSEAPA